jgi:class 3 adenylate cyclase/tetratricopeptide (TPR) repeat protein
MVGSSALSTQLDPEEHRDVVSAFQTCCAGAIERLDGMVAQYLGDGVLAYFGYPAAHEDDAERAIRAGLALIDALPALRPAPQVVLRARIGIATGVVVVGDLIRGGVTQENAAIGETTNLAARLQALAEPDTLLIAPQTHQLVGGMFEYRDLGPHTLKGFDTPVRVHQVLKTSALENRFEARHGAGSSPLLGREEELDFLVRRWQLAKRGEGRVVLLSGEAGIGKSRLTRAIQELVAADSHTRMIYHCSPYHRDSALHPIVNQLMRGAALAPDDDAATKMAKLEALLSQSGKRTGDDIALFAALLSITAGEHYRLPNLTPQQLKERTLGALLGQLKGLCAQQPVLMVFEDLHWVDPTTLELLTRLVEQASGQALFVLVTARPEFVPPWPNDRHFSTVILTRLGRSEVRDLVVNVTGGKPLPGEVLDQIIQRTDGVPLFIEELTKTVLESGLLHDTGARYELTGPLPPMSIPSTLHASLLARLDRLPSVKDVAQIGAAIGREFSYELIAAVAELPEEGLRSALEQLAQAELLFQRGVPPHAAYIFKHALVQDAAYTSLVRSRRQPLHDKIARVLETQYASLVKDEPATLAHHYTEAGLPDRAIPFWSAAGQYSVARSSNVEAVSHFGKALQLLSQQPEGADRDRSELDLRLKYGLPLIAARGYASQEVERHYTATVALSQRLADGNAEFASTRSLWNCVFDRANLDRSLELANRLIEVAQNTGDDAEKNVRISLAGRALGSTLTNRAQFEAAEAALERCLSSGRRFPLATWIQKHGEVPVLVAKQYQGFIWAVQGKLDDAKRVSMEAITLAAALDHPITLTFARSMFNTVQLLRRDYADCIAFAHETYEMSTKQGFVFWNAQNQIHEGCAVAHLYGREEGLDLAERGLENWIATGAVLHVPTWAAFMSDAALHLGRHGRAETMISRATQLIETTGDHYVKAEIERIAGVLALRAGRCEQGHRLLERAIATARLQGAMLFELRATRDLAQSFATVGRSDHAQRLLQPILEAYAQHRTGLDYLDSARLLRRA